MSKPETGILVTVYCALNYKYNIDPHSYVVQYIEGDNNPVTEISFGSKEEMKAVAEGILKALEFTE